MFNKSPTTMEASVGVIVQLVIAAVISHVPLSLPFRRSTTCQLLPPPGTTLTWAVTVP